MNDEPQTTTDPEDRLTDRALSELLGGDAPPDLSERVLAAASRQPLATPVSGEPAMNETRHNSISKRKRWAMFAAAASLFLAVGWLVANRQSEDSRQAQVSTTDNLKALATMSTPSPPAQPSPQDKNTMGVLGLIDDAYSSFPGKVGGAYISRALIHPVLKNPLEYSKSERLISKWGVEDLLRNIFGSGAFGR